MNNNQELILKKLVTKGNQLLNQPRRLEEFTGNSEADKFLNDIKNYPHFFVLACFMDRQIKAEKAWIIPYEIGKIISGFKFNKFLELKEKHIRDIFVSNNLHRFNNKMSKIFYFGIKRIHENYNDDASNIWRKKPKSATVVRRFLQFSGVGIKIASMAVNILARDFKIPMADKLCIDISPDVHVKRVFIRLGLISKSASNEELIYRARELNPEYPGIFDLSCWEIGRHWCRPRTPKCEDCYLNKFCPKEI